MSESVDVLFAKWRQNGDVQSTIDLCEAAAREPFPDARDVSPFVKTRFAGHAGVLLAAGRMQLARGELDDAQDLFVRAGKAAPKDGDVYRFLGETLLRKGDAERAEKVLERAVAFGSRSPDTGDLFEHARRFAPTQKSRGTVALAAEVGRTLGPPGSGFQSVTNVLAQSPLAAPPTAPLPALAPLAPPPLAPPAPIAPQAAAPQPVPVRLPPPLAAQPGRSMGTQPVHSKELPTVAAGVPITPPPLAISPPSMPQPRPPPRVAAPAATSDDLTPWQPPPPVAPAGMIGSSGAGSVAESPYRESGVLKAPDPRDVLDALALAGIFEKDEAAKIPLVWDKAAGSPRRRMSYATMIGGIALSVASVAGIFYFVQNRRAKDHVKAEAILVRVDAQLRAADPHKFGEMEKSIGEAFDLESRSPHASLNWIRERAMKGLVLGPQEIAFEDAVVRGREVGVPESELAFAAAASFLFQGDTAGAAASLGKAEQAASKDAYYQLIAGAVLERAGDPRSLERYAAALQLDPQLYAAAVALARVTAIESDPKRALALATELRTKYADRAEPIALVALAWAKDPSRDKAPPEVQQAMELTELPISLRMVPKAVTAFVKAQARQEQDAKDALKAALNFADSPGQATWIGSVALDVGDQDLARKAALVAVSYSAVYPPARMLAARVALTAGRYDEALKASEDLDAAAIDVAIVRGSASYEKLDIDGVAKATDGIPKETRGFPVVFGVLAMPDAVFARNVPSSAKLLELASSGAPWADVVAMDECLLLGDLDTADKIGALWKDAPQETARTLRLATLARYRGNLEDADKLSLAAVQATPTVRSITERAMVLVAAKKKDDADKLLKAYPTLLGSLGKWLSAYVLASFGKVEDARARTATEEPPESASAFARVLIVSAIGAMKDIRHGQPYVKKAIADGLANPDIATAAEAIHLPKVNPPKR